VKVTNITRNIFRLR